MLKFIKANDLLMVIGFVFLLLPTLHSEEDAAFKVKITLDSTISIKGYVYSDKVYEKNGKKGFEKCKREDEGAGIRLYYVQGTTVVSHFYPEKSIVSVLTLMKVDKTQLIKIEKLWTIEKEKIIKKLESNKEKSNNKKIEQKESLKNTADKLSTDKEVEEGGLREKVEDEESKLLALLQGLSPDKMTDKQILLYFNGFTEADRQTFIKRKNAVGSIAVLKVKEQEFLSHYDRWYNAYKTALQNMEKDK